MEFSKSVIFFLEGNLIGLAVVLEEMLPIGFLGYRCSFFACPGFVFSAQAVEAQEIIGYMLCDGIEIRVITVDDDDAKLVVVIVGTWKAQDSSGVYPQGS